MPTLKIDGKEITVEAGTTLLQAALKNGIDIPHYCYHPALKIAGSCRMCLVELDNQPKLVTSCSIEARDGMNVLTQTDKVKDARRSMLEFFLINHPLDCPICDKAGECWLQDYTFKYGSSHSRFVEDKRVRPTKDLGGNILLYRNRCVMCTRCVRFYEDVVGEPHLLVENRGNHSDISVFPGKGLNHRMTGNIVEICPVGCLIDKDFLFHARVWNLNKQKSICPGCSAGCNINIEFKDNKIYRLRARENQAVNQQWICDDGRYIYHRFANLNRLTAPLIQAAKVQVSTDWDKALLKVKEYFDLLRQANQINQAALVGSAFATNEENYLLKKIFGNELGVGNFYVQVADPVGEDVVFKSGFAIRADKSPNRRGAELILGRQTDFWKAIEDGKITTMVFFNGADTIQLNQQQRDLLMKLDMLIVFDTSKNVLVELAHVALPVGCFGETDGSFVNAQGRVQHFGQALTPPDQAKPGWQALLELYRTFNENAALTSAAEVLNDLAANVQEFKDLTYFKIGAQGEQIEE